MIRRRRADGIPESGLSDRAHAAARRVGASASPARGGLTGALARALRLRRAPADRIEPTVESADAAELCALREELTRELERVATRQGIDREESGAAGAGPARGEDTG